VGVGSGRKEDISAHTSGPGLSSPAPILGGTMTVEEAVTLRRDYDRFKELLNHEKREVVEIIETGYEKSVDIDIFCDNIEASLKELPPYFQHLVNENWRSLLLKL
jgi:hypothetical protein